MSDKQLIIDLFRHPRAADVPNIEDVHRPLSEVGIQEAIAAQEAFAQLAPRVRQVVHSPALRCYSGALILLGAVRPRYAVQSALYPAPDSYLHAAFDMYGYNVRRHLEDGRAHSTLGLYGEQNAGILWESIDRGPGQYVVVSGHAICQNAVAFSLSTIRNFNLGMAKGDQGVYQPNMATCSTLRLFFEAGSYKRFEYLVPR